MNEYRDCVNPDVLLIVAGMIVTRSSVVSPDDKRGLNIAGFDTHAPLLINRFILGFDAVNGAEAPSEEEK